MLGKPALWSAIVRPYMACGEQSEKDEMRTAGLIVAAGRGQRLGGAAPKQYQRLGRGSVLGRAVEGLLAHAGLDVLQVVIHPDDRPLYDAALAGVADPRLRPPVAGADVRAASVLNGLEALADQAPDRVLIHDAARPFASRAVIAAVLDALDAAPGRLPGAAGRRRPLAGRGRQRDRIRAARRASGGRRRRRASASPRSSRRTGRTAARPRTTWRWPGRPGWRCASCRATRRTSRSPRPRDLERARAMTGEQHGYPHRQRLRRARLRPGRRGDALRRQRSPSTAASSAIPTPTSACTR